MLMGWEWRSVPVWQQPTHNFHHFNNRTFLLENSFKNCRFIAGSHIQMVFKKCTNCHTILCSRKKIYRMGDKFVLRDGLDDSSIPPLDLFAGVSMLLLA